MWPIALGPAVAQEAPTLVAPGAFHDELARAKGLVYEGDTRGAIAILDALHERLAAGEEPPASIAHEALVYRGDLHYGAGEPDIARRSFREVLLADPDFVVSPYHHGEEVRALFALVREEVRRELGVRPVPEPAPAPVPQILPPPPDPVVRRRLPMWGYAPFGVPQFRQRRPGAGAGYAVAQGLTLVASISSYTWLVTVNRNPDEHPLGWQEAQIRRTVQTVRFGVQVPATALFYGTWLLSAIDGAGTWRRSQRGSLALDLSVGPTHVGVHGQF